MKIVKMFDVSQMDKCNLSFDKPPPLGVKGNVILFIEFDDNTIEKKIIDF